MSGHSKWHSIKHKKGAADAKRGKIFTKHAHLITIAARNGGDPDMNPGLRFAVDNARTDNLPNANIERAIKRGTGELKDGADFVETQYEGFGPGGTAFLVHALTDNRNRTVSNVRTVFTKNGGNMGGAGTTAWMFQQKGLIIVETIGFDAEEIQLKVIEYGAADVEQEGHILTVVTPPESLYAIKEKLEKDGLKISKSEIEYLPKDYVEIRDEETAKKILKLMEALDDDDDVVRVAGNFDISEELMR